MIKETIGKLLNFDFSDVEIVESNNVFAKVEEGKKFAGGADNAQLSRALMLLAKNNNLGDFEISQTPQFNSCGIMLDVSRNGVMRVDAVCEYISHMAALGLNLLMLYAEDVFEMEDYPYFGYLRGSYSVDELREIDDFAFSLGVEVVPCVQTLGHMTEYLKWSAADSVRDTAHTLMCGEEATYKLIESIVKTMRSAFRSNRIHI